MNIFASGRIEPKNIKFPKNMEKLEWNVASTCKDFELLMERHKIGHVVIDSFGFEDGTAYRVATAMVEISIDKHVALPTIMVIGPDENMKQRIAAYISTTKRWIDISRGK